MVRLFFILLISFIVLAILLDEILTVLIVFLIILILVGALFYRLFKEYLYPVEDAAEAIDEISKGNYQARFHFTRNELLQDLSNRINNMARELTEFSLQEQMQSEQLSTLIDNTESGLMLLDERGYIHLVNRKFIDIFGENEKDYIGSLYYDALDNETIQETVQKVFLYERKVKESFKHHVNIEEMYIEVSGAPIINERNMLKGAVLVLHDITEMKRLEGMRKDFVANVSHELRTPITSIKGFSETLLDGAMHDEEMMVEFLTIIYNESDRIQNLIEDLLALSKLEGDNFMLVLHDVNVLDLYESIKPAISYNAEQKNINLTADVEDIDFKADKNRISQVIINLVDNAINYTPENGNVSLRIYKEEDKVKISVSDTGIGIPEKEIPRIFQRFYRVDKARTRDSGGTGLGLAIVKHIIEVHNGEISVESVVDKGTTITATLPA
jgi:two-component system phosphate regulon sensor histidine kinase PhoR